MRQSISFASFLSGYNRRNAEKNKKTLAILFSISYTDRRCGMIAVKREVAAYQAGFPWSECREPAKTAEETDDKSLYRQ